MCLGCMFLIVRGFFLYLKLAVWLNWLGIETLGFTSLCLSGMGLQLHTAPSFHMGTACPNSSPHSCRSKASATEPSLRPMFKKLPFRVKVNCLVLSFFPRSIGYLLYEWHTFMYQRIWKVLETVLSARRNLQSYWEDNTLKHPKGDHRPLFVCLANETVTAQFLFLNCFNSGCLPHKPLTA